MSAYSEITQVKSAEEIVTAMGKCISPVQFSAHPEVRGRAVSMVDTNKPVIELLEGQSTQEFRVHSKEADGAIVEAMRNLLYNKVEFYTVLRKEWNVHAFHWHC